MKSEANNPESDLYVESRSQALSGLRIDFIVSGGIASIESPKWIRELRRFGASVRVFMTKSAESFVQSKVFEWASAQQVHVELSGSAEHISTADAVVVAPCTLDFMGRLSLGLADSAAAAVCHSKLGRVPFIVSPSMHKSLLESPSYSEHRERLSKIDKLHFLEPKFEEDKAKSPNHEGACDQISHWIRHPSAGLTRVLVLLGRTRSYLDDLRYLSNYSSGALGVELCRELYRWGVSPEIIAGRTDKKIPSYLEYTAAETVDEFAQALSSKDLEDFDFSFFASALLDYEAQAKEEGKKSSENSNWTIELQATKKLIADFGPRLKNLVGFKLESGISEAALEKRVAEWALRRDCKYVVGNLRSEVSGSKHRAYIYEVAKKSGSWVEGKRCLAQKLCELVIRTSTQVQNQAPENPSPRQFG